MFLLTLRHFGAKNRLNFIKPLLAYIKFLNTPSFFKVYHILRVKVLKSKNFQFSRRKKSKLNKTARNFYLFSKNDKLYQNQTKIKIRPACRGFFICPFFKSLLPFFEKCAKLPPLLFYRKDY